jgi:hypothetical protein
MLQLLERIIVPTASQDKDMEETEEVAEGLVEDILQTTTMVIHQVTIRHLVAQTVVEKHKTQPQAMGEMEMHRFLTVELASCKREVIPEYRLVETDLFSRETPTVLLELMPRRTQEL